MTERVSDRLLAQRLRNRIMEGVLELSLGASRIGEIGAAEWVNSFFDWMPLDDSTQFSNPAMTADEGKAVTMLRDLMIEVCHQVPEMVTPEELLATGWPERIRPHAERALALMRSRGRFSEDKEEAEPSDMTQWP